VEGSGCPQVYTSGYATASVSESVTYVTVFILARAITVADSKTVAQLEKIKIS